MNYESQKSMRPKSQTAATFLPPATVEETGWDILLALHWDRDGKLSLEKLACLVSVSDRILSEWLALLEERELISGAKHGPNEELRAVLTPAGRDLLDHYLSATAGLQIAAQH